MASGKLAEGMEYVRQAEKSLKTSLFKWRPDYEDAAMDYANAATCFKNARAFPQCKDSLLKAADCHRQHHSLFSSAKSLEQAALIAKDMGDLNETVSLIERACVLFQQHGAPDTAALSFEKGAKMVEAKAPDKAASLYLKSAEVSLMEDKPRQAADLLGRAARLQVKMKMYDEAANTIQREMDLQITSENGPAAGRLAVALVLVHLTLGDLIAAQKAYQNGTSFIEDDEAQTIETLLEAYDQEDGELAGRALNSPFLKHIDVEYAKLARSLRIPNTGISSGSSRLSERQSSSASTESFSSLSARGSQPNAFDDTSVSLRKQSTDTLTAFGGIMPEASTDDNKLNTKAEVDAEADDEYAGGLC